MCLKKFAWRLEYGPAATRTKRLSMMSIHDREPVQSCAFAYDVDVTLIVLAYRFYELRLGLRDRNL